MKGQDGLSMSKDSERITKLEERVDNIESIIHVRVKCRYCFDRNWFQKMIKPCEKCNGCGMMSERLIKKE